MITVPELAAEALGSFLGAEMQRTFGSSHARLTELIPSVARLALECIGNSDALYHNVEHTMLVTLAGRDILRGRALLKRTTPSDWTHVLVACLMHDIGFVRSLLKGDDADGCVCDAAGRKVALPRGASDAALAPYHVDRSKLFVLERMADIEVLDSERIARAIEFTRFPVAATLNERDNDEDGLLLRAADLIGQLGDPQYLRKANALYHEFEETGINKQLGYANPADVVDQYPQFYWNSVAPHVQAAIKYMEVTASGRQWIANLYSNVFRAERDLNATSHSRETAPRLLVHNLGRDRPRPV
jgi:hypothetical protein